MYSYYLNDIKTIRELFPRCPIARELYETVSKKTSHLDIEDLKQTLHKILLNTPRIPQDYFKQYYDRLFYEIIFEIYHYAKIELLQQQKVPSITDCINQTHIQFPTKASVAETISRNKNYILNDFFTMKYLSTTNRKLNNFYEHMGLWNSDSSKIFPLMMPENIVNILWHYSDSIYNHKNSKDGILLHTVTKIFDDYLQNFSMHTCFKKEYCFYEYNQIYFLIQYSMCCSSYLTQTFADKNIPTEYFPLYIYSKLYDTPYISLAEFIHNKHHETLNNIYKDPSIAHTVLIDKELLNGFWLPIINLCLKETFFTNNQENFDSICKKCKEWLDTQIVYSQDTFISHSLKAQDTLKKSTYPNAHNHNKPKSICLIENAKTDSRNQQFNVVMSKAFFYNDFPHYLSYCSSIPTLACSPDYCLTFINDTYYLKYLDGAHKILKECREYKSSKHEPGIITL